VSKVFEEDGELYANSVRLANPLGILKLGDGENRNQAGNRMVSFSVTPRYQFNRRLYLS
jgi:hypothetical protein